jgi:uncharacterized protein YggE
MLKKMSLALIALLALACVAAAGEMTITGEGKVSAKPDVGYVNLGVVTQANIAVESVEKNTAAMKKLFKSLTADLGIPLEDIQTSDFSVRPDYVYKKDDEPQLVGYTTSNNVTVTVCDLTKMGKVLDVLVKGGANQVRGVSFGVKDSAPLLDKARKLAAQDAKRKAQLYADALGVKLGSLKSLQENNYGRPQPRLYAATASMRSERADVPVSGGELSFSVQVSVVR